MCCNYRALNKIIVKNKYPIPLVADCFDRLSQAKYFTKIDLRSGYWQVRIKEGDEAKTTVVTRYGVFEFLVMPFGLTNAPATFSTLMNRVLHGFLDEFVMVYFDDIVIYSRIFAKHVEHLWQVLARLHEYELYTKVSKCSFAQDTISFLGHIMERGRIWMDPKKVQAIKEWQPPSDVHDLLISRPSELLQAFCEELLRNNTAHDGLIEEDGDLELDTPMPRILRQIEVSNGDRSCVGLTRYVETLRGGDRRFRLRIRRGPNTRRPPSCLREQKT
ncbi:UNVERIFIED_CONTAM: RNA-directed DNA polymerase [Sesamum latifolium]|uniref:RNA-directed DNA polymerase n=1 Tax=Sesamum latifolium TaxID=2727402 RepID=A0AAW2WY61_9LAMI